MVQIWKKFKLKNIIVKVIHLYFCLMMTGKQQNKPN